jgi:Class II Aldolase and Adducin N-terminal domain
MTVGADVAGVVADLRLEVARLHAELVRWGVVVWRTAGNVSVRVPGRDLLVIKPCGVGYDELSPALWPSPTATAPSSTAPAPRPPTLPPTPTSIDICRTSAVSYTPICTCKLDISGSESEYAADQAIYWSVTGF